MLAGGLAAAERLFPPPKPRRLRLRSQAGIAENIGVSDSLVDGSFIGVEFIFTDMGGPSGVNVLGGQNGVAICRFHGAKMKAEPLRQVVEAPDRASVPIYSYITDMWFT
jgi:hypothetical protein